MAGTPNSMLLPQVARSPLSVIVTAANTAYSGSSIPTAIIPLFQAGTNGSVIRRLKARPILTTTATSLTLTQVQLLKSTNGTAYVLDDDASLAAQASISVTTGAPTPADFLYTDAASRYATAGYFYYVGISVAYANGILFTADVADF